MQADLIANVSGRARTAILAAAIADVHAASIRLALFEAPPRLSPELRLMLATCEAVTRSGGAGNAFVDALAQLTSGGKTIASGDDDPDTGPAAAAICAAPLAFVLEPSDARDEATVREAVSILGGGLPAHVGALTMCLALRHSLEHGTLSDFVPPETSAASRIVGTAIEIAAASLASGDFDSLLAQAAAGDHPRHVGCLAAMLCGAAGMELPGSHADTLPERQELERVVEPFAQLVASGNFAV